MDHIPDDLLELQARLDRWRANRKHNREPIPDQCMLLGSVLD